MNSRSKTHTHQGIQGTPRSYGQVSARKKAYKALRHPAVEPNDLPIVCSPLDLPAEAAAELLEFLTHLTETIERHYFGELHRLPQHRSAQNRDPPHPPLYPSPSDPPS